MQRKKIGQYLVEEKTLSRDQLEKALQIQATQKRGRNLTLIGMVLVGMGAIKEHDLTQALAEQQRDRIHLQA